MIGKKHFLIFFFLILAVSFVIRIYPTFGNNFYFTVDQGNDAVHAREWFERGVLLKKGPETGISGVYAGPLWYYFIGIGYKLFQGDPFGGLIMMILLNLATTSLVVWVLYKNISAKVSLIVGIFLQIFWHFYDISRYTFNPFPVVFLSILQIFSLTYFLGGRKRFYWASLASVLLTFNCAVAAGGALLLFHLGVGACGVKKKLITAKEYILGNFVVPGLLLSPIILSVYKQAQASSLVSSIDPNRGYFTGTNFIFMLERFGEILQRSIFQQSLVVSILVVATLVIFWFRSNKQNPFIKKFVILTGILWIISFFWFGSNRGWQDWHTIYLYSLTFISIVVLITQFPRKFSFAILSLIFISQFLVFKDRYIEYLKPSEDSSMLYNRLAAIDWIYNASEGQGFNIYTFTPHIYDYPSQYLFWWYGRKTYGFVPCEYSVEPGYLKHLYVPGAESYSKPTLGCDMFRFVVIEPGNIQAKKLEALQKLKENTVFVEEKQVGGVLVEKRRAKRQEEL